MALSIPQVFKDTSGLKVLSSEKRMLEEMPLLLAKIKK